MTAAKCDNCGERISRKKLPFCRKCRLLVLEIEEFDLRPDSPIEHIYNDDEEDFYKKH